MEPRIVLRTHYQVDEPAYLRQLVHSCTSPVRSAYPEAVAEKLAREVRRRGKHFNVPAAGYVVDLAHGLSLINEQSVWTPKGHLVGLFPGPTEGEWQEQLALSERERLIYLRIFLEGDGAALLFLARYVGEHGLIPASDDDWNSLAQQMFVATYREYLRLTNTTADRVALRGEVERIEARGYAGKSGSHKLFVHLQTMFRLGLLDRATGAGPRRYSRSASGGFDSLAALVEEIPGPYELEQVAKDDNWMDVVGRVLGVPTANGNLDPAELWAQLASIYRRIVETGAPLCPLGTLVEALQVEWATLQGQLVEYGTVIEIIQASQRKHVRDIRFHVDRRGRPAFIKLSDEFVSDHLGAAAQS